MQKGRNNNTRFPKTIELDAIKQRPMVLRLDAKSRPMLAEERSILDSLNAVILEVEDLYNENIEQIALEKIDAVIISAKNLHADVIKKMTRCRIISRMGVGVDKIDIEQATRQGILVTNLPGFCVQEVADHTMALLLACARMLKEFEKEMRKGYRIPILLDGKIHRLSNCILGIIGFGNIGRAVAIRARGFGMRILVYDPKIQKKDEHEYKVSAVEFEELLKLSDFVVLVCPLTPQTKQMFKIEQFRMMKKTSVIINTGRGGLIKEDDLVDALTEGVIRYAALDVFEGIDVLNPAGFKTDNPLFLLENVLMTPHMASSSVEMIPEQRIRSANAVVDVLSGQWPEDLVNPEVIPWFIANKKGR